jgi:isochorismate hydrolase
VTQPTLPSQTRTQRSSDLLDRLRSRLLIVDVQEKLLPVIPDADTIIASCEYLTRVAMIMDVPIVVSEQYPQGLGSTVAAISSHVTAIHVFEKMRFSAADGFDLHCQTDVTTESPKRNQVVITGIETHICVLQTAIDLLSQGQQVFVVDDATGSRNQTDRDVALRRIRDAGGIVVTAECAAYEWCQVAGSGEFKRISRLTRDRDAVRGV